MIVFKVVRTVEEFRTNFLFLLNLLLSCYGPLWLDHFRGQFEKHKVHHRTEEGPCTGPANPKILYNMDLPYLVKMNRYDFFVGIL